MSNNNNSNRFNSLAESDSEDSDGSTRRKSGKGSYRDSRAKNSSNVQNDAPPVSNKRTYDQHDDSEWTTVGNDRPSSYDRQGDSKRTKTNNYESERNDPSSQPFRCQSSSYSAQTTRTSSKNPSDNYFHPPSVSSSSVYNPKNTQWKSASSHYAPQSSSSSSNGPLRNENSSKSGNSAPVTGIARAGGSSAIKTTTTKNTRPTHNPSGTSAQSGGATVSNYTAPSPAPTEPYSVSFPPILTNHQNVSTSSQIAPVSTETPQSTSAQSSVSALSLDRRFRKLMPARFVNSAYIPETKNNNDVTKSSKISELISKGAKPDPNLLNLNGYVHQKLLPSKFVLDDMNDVLRIPDPNDRFEQYIRRTRLQLTRNNDYYCSKSSVLLSAKTALGITSHTQLSPSYNSFEDSPAIAEMTRIEEFLSTYIMTFLSTRVVATFYDLITEICMHFRVAKFSEINMGNFCKHPTIERVFGSGLTEACMATFTDVLKAYDEVIGRSCTAKASNVTADMVLTGVSDYLKIPKSNLGVKIRDVGYLERLLEHQKRENSAKQKVFMRQMDQIYTSQFEKYQQDYQSSSQLKWTEALEKAFNLYRKESPGTPGNRSYPKLKALNNGVELEGFANYWEYNAGNMLIKDALTFMPTLNNPEKYVHPVVSLTALYLYTLSRQTDAFKPLEGILPPEPDLETRFSSTWLERLKKGNWRFDDVLKYLSDGVKGSNLPLYICSARVIFGSLMPTIEMDSTVLESIRKTNLSTLELKSLVLEKVKNLNDGKMSGPQLLSIVESKIEQMIPSNAFRTEKASGKRTFLQFVSTKCPEIRFSVNVDDGSRPGQVVSQSGAVDTESSDGKDISKDISFEDVKDAVVDAVEKTKKISGYVNAVLEWLDEVESTTMKNLNVPTRSFESLGNGKLSSFIRGHLSIGGTQSLIPRPIQKRALVSQTRLLNFVSQCFAAMPESQDISPIALALESQFGITQYPMNELNDLATKVKKTPNIKVTIVYECALICGSEEQNSYKFPSIHLHPDIESVQNQVGHMGYISNTELYSWICKVPLLEDVANLVHWDEIAQPTYGSLAKFLETQMQTLGESFQSMFMESPSGVIMRLPRFGSISDIQRFISLLSPRETAAWLVAGVADVGGTSMISSAMWRASIVKGLKEVYNKSKDFTVCYEFVVRCIGWFPSRLAQFLVGLMSDSMMEFGSTHGLSKKEVIDGMVLSAKKLYLDYGEKNGRLMLQKTGIRKSVSEWVDDFKEMLQVESKKDDRKSVITVNQLRSQMKNANVKPPVEKSKIIVDRDENVNSLEECEGIIESIREKEFGIGLVSDDSKAQQVLIAQYSRGCRALQRLSEELYSQDSHFALELLQNADDNNYLSGEIPTVEFVITNNEVAVMNNEFGFTEKNVRALCDIGKSTKVKGQSGYIGHKGIGFKSVFRISDQPEIHSNNYHIRFSATDYIIPKWIGKRSQAFLKRIFTDDDILALEKRTLVLLPVREEMKQKGGMGRLLSKFSDIHPSLLLFLHRVRRIVIKDKINDKEREMVREDLGNGTVVVRHGDSTSRWMVVTRKLTPEKGHRDGVDSTELSLAFPLDLDPLTQPPQQQVFAFLPLRSYGYRFIIQGDFIVPSSREEVDRDSLWNEWLRSEVSLLFIQAFHEYNGRQDVQDPALNNVAFLKFVPLEGETNGFFKPIARDILKLLDESECLYTRSGRYTHPRNTLVIDLPKSSKSSLSKRYQELYEVLEDNLLERTMNLRHLHPTLANNLPPTLLTSLSVKLFSISHVVTILEALTQSQQLSESYLKKKGWIGRLLLLIHSLADGTAPEDYGNAIERLRYVPFIPILGSDNFVSVNEARIFLSEYKQEAKVLKDTMGSDSGLSELRRVDFEHLMDLRDHLSKISGELEGSEKWKQIERGWFIKATTVKSMLTTLGVKQLTSHEVIIYHVIPLVAELERIPITCKCNEDRALCPCTNDDSIEDCLCLFELQYPEEAFNRLVQIKTHILKCEQCEVEDVWNLIRTKIPVATSNGQFLTLATAETRGGIHFHKAYNSKIAVDKLFGWISINPRYLELETLKVQSRDGGRSIGVGYRGEVVETWRQFFSKLGVTDFLKIQKRQQVLDSAVAVKRYGNFGVKGGVDVQLTDYYGPEFERFAEILASMENETVGDEIIAGIRQLIVGLDDNWSDFKDYLGVSILQTGADGGGTLKVDFTFCASKERFPVVAESRFLQSLYALKWVTSSTGSPSRPCDLFIPLPEVVDVFGELVSYIDYCPKNDELVQAMKLRRKITEEDVIEIINGMVTYYTEQEDDVELPELSILQLFKMYEFLLKEMGEVRFKNFANLSVTAAATAQEPFNFNFSSSSTTQYGTTGLEVAGIRPKNRRFIYVLRPDSQKKVDFVDITSCVFQDPLSILSDIESDMVVLFDTYGRLPQSMKEQVMRVFLAMGVSEIPSLEHFAAALVAIGRNEPDQLVFQRSVFISSILADLMNKDMSNNDPSISLTRAQLVAIFKTNKILPSHKLEWVQLSDNVFINDDTQKGKHLSDLDGLHFVGSWMPDSKERSTELLAPPDNLIDLYENIGIPRLSNSVEIEVNGTEEKSPLWLVSMIQDALACLQFYLYSHDQKRYDELIADGVVEAAKSILIKVWKEVTVVYSVGDIKSNPVAVDHVFECREPDLRDSNMKISTPLHISPTATYVFNVVDRVLNVKDTVRDIVNEFLKVFFKGRENEDAVDFVTLCVGVGFAAHWEMAQLFKSQKIKQMPIDTVKWSLDVNQYEKFAGEMGTNEWWEDDVLFEDETAGLPTDNEVDQPDASESEVEIRPAKRKRGDLEANTPAQSSCRPPPATANPRRNRPTFVPLTTQLTNVDAQVPINQGILTHSGTIIDANFGSMVIDQKYKERLKWKTWDNYDTGYAGELIIYLYLKELHKGNPKKRVVWVNKDTESGRQHDIEIHDLTDPNNLKIQYIEVKATVSNRKEFALSRSEFWFAWNNPDVFSVYRVMNIRPATMDRFFKPVAERTVSRYNAIEIIKVPRLMERWNSGDVALAFIYRNQENEGTLFFEKVAF